MRPNDGNRWFPVRVDEALILSDYQGAIPAPRQWRGNLLVGDVNGESPYTTLAGLTTVEEVRQLGALRSLPGGSIVARAVAAQGGRGYTFGRASIGAYGLWVYGAPTADGEWVGYVLGWYTYQSGPDVTAFLQTLARSTLPSAAGAVVADQSNLVGRAQFAGLGVSAPRIPAGAVGEAASGNAPIAVAPGDDILPVADGGSGIGLLLLLLLGIYLATRKG